MKACPYCAEQIQDAAIVCRFCNRELTPAATPVDRSQLSGRDLLVPPVRKPVNIFKWVASISAVVMVLGFASVYFAEDSRKFEAWKVRRDDWNRRCDAPRAAGRAADPATYDRCKDEMELIALEGRNAGWVK